MENEPGLEDGTIDVEHLLVEPQDGHVSMDSVMCFHEKIPHNTMDMEAVSRSFGVSNTGIAQEGRDILNGDVLDAMPSEVDGGYFRLPNDFCSMGEDYLLGFEFAESITNLDYGSTEGLQTSIPDSSILASNAGTDTPWKSDLFRITEVPERQSSQLILGDIPTSRPESETLVEDKPLKSQYIVNYNDISSCSFQDILSDENVASSSSVEMLCSPKIEKSDEFPGKDALATMSGQTSLSDSPPKQKRSRKPTQRYIDELSDPISRYPKKRREASSSTLKDKDHKKCHVGSKAVRLPEEESSLIAIQVPFGSLAHNECPKTQAYDMGHNSERGNSTTKSKDNRFTPENQKKRDECTTTSVHPKKREDYVPAASKKKRDDFVSPAHLKKRDDHITTSTKSPKKKDDWIISVSPKKRDARVTAMSKKKRDEKRDECLDSDSPEEVSGKRKHHRLWTISETRKLIDGVSQYGVGRWSRIKKLFFSASAHRTSVDLKDKWRNLLKASGFKEQGNRQGEKKRNMAWRPLPKSILRRVCELATMYPYPKGPKHTIGHIHHRDSPDRSTDITLSDYRKILRSINGN